MLSNQKATVSYAIDLLKAHQMRRENAFLHEELQRYREEIDVLSSDVKNLKTEVSFSLQDHTVQLREQSQKLHNLQQSKDALQSEVSALRFACDQNRDNEQNLSVLLQKELAACGLAGQKVADTRQEEEEMITTLISALKHTVEGKADAPSVEGLKNRTNQLCHQPRQCLPTSSISRIPDSCENQPQSLLPGRNLGILVV